MALDPISFASGALPLGTMKTQTAATATASGPASFTDVLASLARQSAANVKSAEDTAMKGIQGQAPLQEVVQAVLKAETSLQTALALRDKAVSAYQDLTRMSI